MTANAQLQSFIDRIENLVTEREAISAGIREVKAEAKSSGFDLPTINRLLKLRKLSDQERREQEHLLEAYEASLGALKDTPLGDAAMERMKADPEERDGRVDNVITSAPELVARAKAVLFDQDAREDGTRTASTSYVQRKLELGYNTAARLIEQLEREGFVSAANHAGKRTVLVTSPTTSVVPPDARA